MDSRPRRSDRNSVLVGDERRPDVVGRGRDGRHRLVGRVEPQQRLHRRRCLQPHVQSGTEHQHRRTDRLRGRDRGEGACLGPAQPGRDRVGEHGEEADFLGGEGPGRTVAPQIQPGPAAESIPEHQGRNVCHAERGLCLAPERGRGQISVRRPIQGADGCARRDHVGPAIDPGEIAQTSEPGQIRPAQTGNVGQRRSTDPGHRIGQQPGVRVERDDPPDFGQHLFAQHFRGEGAGAEPVDGLPRQDHPRGHEFRICPDRTVARTHRSVRRYPRNSGWDAACERRTLIPCSPCISPMRSPTTTPGKPRSTATTGYVATMACWRTG
ncbi:hypothetical protein NS506_02818 [Nocardia seriolae]|uniref:Uncharacterized protein n=1 Tax=Nocardia seriolae TaxID=37332 RepID=A0ABC8ARZ5_9NOCA|nr:hypothetical protein NS506_02818 [Nocardia seriolae]